MDEKLNNEDFVVKRVDGNVLDGDSNKIKLKMVSFATVMEVQEEFIERELKSMDAEISAMVRNGGDDKQIDEAINAHLDFVDIRDDFLKSKKRFISMAKKALKLPERN